MIARRSALALFAASAFAVSPFFRAQAAEKGKDTIAIIGTGKVGSVLGKRLAALGYKIIYGSRTPDAEQVKALVKDTGKNASAATVVEAGRQASLILMAVPWVAAKDVVANLGDVNGKILLDPSNPVKVTDGRFEAPAALATSSAEEMQAAAPSAHVVKVFNTLSVEIMTDPKAAGGAISVPLAGNNAESKARVADIVTAMGLEPVDVGGLYVSRTLEGMARLRMSYRAKNKPNAFEFYLRPRKD
jgi:predicted dinucleotide-binding enzyme